MSEISQVMMEDVNRAYREDNTKIARSVFSKDLKLDEINKNASTYSRRLILKTTLIKFNRLYLSFQLSGSWNG